MSSSRLLFVRHGATAANLADLRCGGDLDLPLADEGRAQAIALARRLAAMPQPPGLVITSDLRRTRDTAMLIARSLPGVEILVRPELAERRLGLWNLRPIAETQRWLDDRVAPPSGESHVAFGRRIAEAVDALLPLLPSRPLVVGSKGVARVLRELCGMPAAAPLDNAATIEFDLSCISRSRAEGAAAC
jgi:probable phosphoglycerate mutase